MSELRALQHAFGASLGSVDGARANASIFRGAPERVLARLAVYRGNVVGAAGKALAGAYPIVVKIVGEEFFEGLAREYLRVHPSVGGDLNEFGESFAEFVAGFPHTQDLPYLADVARMEWLAHRAHYAADAEALDLGRLGAVPEEAYGRLRLSLAPGCALMASCWPLARVWEVHQDDFEGEFSVDLDSGPQRILIYRPNYRVLVGVLGAGGYRFLQAVASGAPLAGAVDAALAAEPDFALGTALAAWVEAGVIADARTEADT
ncbi:MAG: DNA-binding domain-containing protein [Burkholderiales bacterium]